MEAIDFLVKMKKTVHVFESLENLLPKYFDKEMVADVQKSLEKQAVIFHFEETVLGIEETANGIVLETSEQKISCDSGIFALNLHPQLAYLDKKFNEIWIRQSRWMLIYKLQCQMFCHRRLHFSYE